MEACRLFGPASAAGAPAGIGRGRPAAPQQQDAAHFWAVRSSHLKDWSRSGTPCQHASCAPCVAFPSSLLPSLVCRSWAGWRGARYWMRRRWRGCHGPRGRERVAPPRAVRPLQDLWLCSACMSMLATNCRPAPAPLSSLLNSHTSKGAFKCLHQGIGTCHVRLPFWRHAGPEHERKQGTGQGEELQGLKCCFAAFLQGASAGGGPGLVGAPQCVGHGHAAGGAGRCAPRLGAARCCRPGKGPAAAPCQGRAAGVDFLHQGVTFVLLAAHSSGNPGGARSPPGALLTG